MEGGGGMKWTQTEHDFVSKNVDCLSDPDMAKILGRTTQSIRRYRQKNKINRSLDFAKELIDKNRPSSTDQRGANNPNWKGGISKNHYHYKLIQRERYPEHEKARMITYRAIRSGKIKREPCEICGLEKVHAHHDDYSKPLKIRWLCRKHHR